MERAHAGIGLGQLVEQRRCPVAARVIHEDELEGQTLACGAHPLVERADRLLLVEHRSDDAEEAQLAFLRGHRQRG